MLYLCTAFQKNGTKLQKINHLNKQFMKKVFQIVLYYDKFGIHKILESNFLIDDERTAIMIADSLCKQKKIYFKLKEMYI